MSTLPTINLGIDGWRLRAWREGDAPALTERAFGDSETMRVFAPIHADNAASMRVVEKCGFIREGVLRQSAIKSGRVIDRVLYATHRAMVENAASAHLSTL